MSRRPRSVIRSANWKRKAEENSRSGVFACPCTLMVRVFFLLVHLPTASGPFDSEALDVARILERSVTGAPIGAAEG